MCFYKWKKEIQKLDLIKGEEEMILPYYFLASHSLYSISYQILYITEAWGICECSQK
jgi:hypothetical protein